VGEKSWPETGDLGPRMKDGVDKQQPSSIAIAKTEQGDRHDPVTVIINGEPVAKGRPRMTRRGFVYTPATTRKFEAHGRLAAQLAMDGRPPIEVPVRIELLVELPVPASWSRRKTADAITGHIRPTSRPDVDNYLKAILDAINTIVVADDAQVVEVYAKKKFSVAPKMIATIFPLDATPSNRRTSR
jgi:Holliday junction resolvase RusA-like endonuclease